MIIDCHSHVWSGPGKLGGAKGFSCLCGFGSTAVFQADIEQHQTATAPADAVLLLGFVSNLLNTELSNTFISSYVATAPERLIGFAGIDPTTMASVADEVARLRLEGKFSGLVLSPACQGYHPCNSRVMCLYEAAERLAMPIYFLYGDAMPKEAVLEYGTIGGLDEVARSFPNLKMIISHMGFPWVDQTIAMLAKHPNVFADVAGLSSKPWQAYRSLSLAYEYGVISKLLFASDFPNRTVKIAAEAIYNLNKLTLGSVLPAIPREQLRGIVERDSLSLLGLTVAGSENTNGR